MAKTVIIHYPLLSLHSIRTSSEFVRRLLNSGKKSATLGQEKEMEGLFIEVFHSSKHLQSAYRSSSKSSTRPQDIIGLVQCTCHMTRIMFLMRILVPKGTEPIAACGAAEISSVCVANLN